VVGTPDYGFDVSYSGAVTPANRQEDYMSVISKIALASISSQGTMGGLLVTGFVSVGCFAKAEISGSSSTHMMLLLFIR